MEYGILGKNNAPSTKGNTMEDEMKYNVRFTMSRDE